MEYTRYGLNLALKKYRTAPDLIVPTEYSVGTIYSVSMVQLSFCIFVHPSIFSFCITVLYVVLQYYVFSCRPTKNGVPPRDISLPRSEYSPFPPSGSTVYLVFPRKLSVIAVFGSNFQSFVRCFC